MPSHCTGAGDVSAERGHHSGTTGDVAEIGATIPIAPTAIPR